MGPESRAKPHRGWLAVVAGAVVGASATWAAPVLATSCPGEESEVLELSLVSAEPDGNGVQWPRGATVVADDPDSVEIRLRHESGHMPELNLGFTSETQP